MADNFNQLLSSLLSPNLGGGFSSVFSGAPVGSTGRTGLGYDPNMPIGVFQGSNQGTPPMADSNQSMFQGNDVGIGRIMSMLLNSPPSFNATAQPAATPTATPAPTPTKSPLATNPIITRPYGVNF